MNVPLTVVRLTPDPDDAIRDQEQIRPHVLAWRDGLSRALRKGPGLAEDLNWDESADSPYFTDKPTWDCYGDLMLRAAHDEQPELACPVAHLGDWGSDPAYKICAREGHASRYSHLNDVELWLPCPFGYVFRTEDVLGKSVLVGSSVTLLTQTGRPQSARVASWSGLHWATATGWSRARSAARSRRSFCVCHLPGTRTAFRRKATSDAPGLVAYLKRHIILIHPPAHRRRVRWRSRRSLPAPRRALHWFLLRILIAAAGGVAASAS